MRKKNIVFLFFIAFLFLVPSWARGNIAGIENKKNQLNDSLKERIDEQIIKAPDSAYFLLMQLKESEQNGSRRINRCFIENRISRYFLQQDQLDSAQFHIEKALKTVDKTKSPGNYYAQISDLAHILQQKGRYDTAVVLYEKAIGWYENHDDSAALGVALSQQALALIYSGNNEKAMEVSIEAEDYLKKTGTPYQLGKNYENMARININLGYEKRVITHTLKAIECFKKMEDPSHLASAYANLGVSYKELEQYDTAISYYEKSVALALESDDPECLAKNYMNMANAYDLSGNRQKGMEYYYKSLDICRENDIFFGVYLNTINLAEVSLQDKKFDQAIELLDEALKTGKEHDFPNRDVVFENLYFAWKNSKNYPKALEYHEKWMALKDSAHEAQKHREIMDIQTRYETQKKEARILQLKNREQKEAYLRNLLFISLVGVVIISVLLLFWFNQKRARIRQKATLLEKENQIKNDQVEKLTLGKKLQEEEAKRYKLDLQLKEQELVFQTLKKAHIEQTNKSVKEKLNPFIYRFTRKRDQQEFSENLREITLDTKQDPLSDFEQMFLQMHGHFYEKLLKTDDSFSRSELQLCALLRMNLPSKEIAGLLNLSLSTIDQRRHQIRKKLKLESNQNLISYLIAL